MTTASAVPKKRFIPISFAWPGPANPTAGLRRRDRGVERRRVRRERSGRASSGRRRVPREVVSVGAQHAPLGVADDALVVRVALERLASRAADELLHGKAR